jgi:phage shock protein C
MSETRLTRSSSDHIIAGVCGGLAKYLEIDAVFVRLAFVILLFASGIGFPIYVILWVIMPEEDDETAGSGAAIQKNMDEFGESVQSGVSRIGRTGTFGTLLILLGAYFLLSEIGLFDWISGAVFWPVVLIGFGIYLLVQRSKKTA